MTEDWTTCSVCNRALNKGDTNTSGRCIDCAGHHVGDVSEAARQTNEVPEAGRSAGRVMTRESSDESK